MHFEIIVTNGCCPLVYMCTTMHEAYECIDTLAQGLLARVDIDLDLIMKTLVDMAYGSTIGFSGNMFAIAYREGEV